MLWTKKEKIAALVLALALALMYPSLLVALPLLLLLR